MTIIRAITLLAVLVGASAAFTSPSRAITAELAKKCKIMADAAYPRRSAANPAAGSSKGTARDITAYFNKCVANNGKVDDGNAQTTGGPAAPSK